MVLQILVQRLHEAIGTPLDLEHGLMFFGDLIGGVYVLRRDGTEKRTLFTDLGNITGVEYINCYLSFVWVYLLLVLSLDLILFNDTMCNYMKSVV
jgi:hypothetical protein